MDFFERQDQARRNTKLLVVLFRYRRRHARSWRCMPRCWGSLRASASSEHHGYSEQAQLVLWNPKLFLVAAVGTLAVIALGSGFKTLELAQGGSAVATMLGGRLVSPTTTDPDERKLRNVVEEMAIAAGIPVPQIYVLPGEAGHQRVCRRPLHERRRGRCHRRGHDGCSRAMSCKASSATSSATSSMATCGSTCG